MKIDLLDLKPSVTVTLTGNEPWLETIYGTFEPAPKGQEPARITGSLVVKKTSGGNIIISSSLSFAPFVTCGRCALPIAWPLDLNFELDCRQESAKQADVPRERDLKEEELDIYLFSGEVLEMEPIINEMIQIALPTQTIKRDEHDQCGICHKDLSDTLAYGSNISIKENPFAVLKNLKN